MEKRRKQVAVEKTRTPRSEVKSRDRETEWERQIPDESSENHNWNTKIVNFRKSKVEHDGDDDGNIYIYRKWVEHFAKAPLARLHLHTNRQRPIQRTANDDDERERWGGERQIVVSRNKCHHYYTYEHIQFLPRVLIELQCRQWIRCIVVVWCWMVKLSVSRYW